MARMTKTTAAPAAPAAAPAPRVARYSDVLSDTARRLAYSLGNARRYREEIVERMQADPAHASERIASRLAGLAAEEAKTAALVHSLALLTGSDQSGGRDHLFRVAAEARRAVCNLARWGAEQSSDHVASAVSVPACKAKADAWSDLADALEAAADEDGGYGFPGGGYEDDAAAIPAEFRELVAALVVAASGSASWVHEGPVRVRPRA